MGTSDLPDGSTISDPPKTTQEPPLYHNSTIISLIFFISNLTTLLSFNLKEIFGSPPLRKNQYQLPQIKGNQQMSAIETKHVINFQPDSDAC